MNFALIGPGGSYHINNFPRIANETMEIQVCYRVIPINNINTLYRVSDYQQKPHGRMERFYYSHRNHTKVKYQSLTSNDKISTMDMWQGVVSFEDKKKNMKSWSQLFTVPIVNVKQPSGN
jgi:hypothetical protein